MTAILACTTLDNVVLASRIVTAVGQEGVPGHMVPSELVRLRADGSFDPSFDGDGVLPLGAVGLDFTFAETDVAVDSLGRTLVVSKTGEVTRLVTDHFKPPSSLTQLARYSRMTSRG